MRRTAGTSYFASTQVGKTNPHAVYVTIDGGEWGDPLDREPERVEMNPREEYVSVRGAFRYYEVVVTPKRRRESGCRPRGERGGARVSPVPLSRNVKEESRCLQYTG